MRSVAEWTLDDLKALIGQEEGQTLEFKRSAKLLNKSWRPELAQSVSAMANAVGGLIVIGIAENEATKSVAGSIDEGLHPDQMTTDQLVQTLNAGILPHLEGLTIKAIPLGTGSFAFAIEVKGDKPEAPFQVQHSQRYYLRQGIETKPLYDFQIRDILNRRTKPNLEVKFDFSECDNPNIWFLQVSLLNTGNEPALYYAYDVFYDARIKGLPQHGDFIFSFVDARGLEYPCRVKSSQCAVPTDPPVYKERPVKLFEAFVRLDEAQRYALGFSVVCPGCANASTGHIIRTGRSLKKNMGDGAIRAPNFTEGVTIDGSKIF